ncbi:MAG TPA: hypothetical protein VFD58_16835 [Blastocatellia bacterium]|nr:hypothetical protein [Blastocatellia bacterium]
MGMLWLSAGIVIVLLSLWLQQGRRMAAALPGLALVVWLILVWRWLAQQWQQLPPGGGGMSILLLLAFVPIAFFLIGGIEAINESRQPGWAASFGPAESGLPAGPHRSDPDGQKVSDRVGLFTTLLQRASEVMVLTGAGMLLVNAVFAARGSDGIEWLSLVGIVSLMLGVNLSLRVGHPARKKTRECSLCGKRSPILLLSKENEILKVRARFTLNRPLVTSFPRLPLARVIEELLSRIAPVISISEAEHLMTAVIVREYPARSRNRKASDRQCRSTVMLDETTGERAEAVRGRKIERWMQASQAVVLILGRVESLRGTCRAAAEQVLRQKGIVIFPPVDIRQLRSRWERFCGQFPGEMAQLPLSGGELGKAVLLVFRDKQEPLLITADRRDEWAYQAAFQFAAARLRSDQVIIR